VIFGAITYLSFTQRDALSVCLAKFEAASANNIVETSCKFFGQDISLKGLSE
jgi:hypothetical protein